MYHPHPVFKSPEDEELKIWRYMDFTKFVALIDTQQVFFARADRLGDPFEGSYPGLDVQARKDLFTKELGESERLFEYLQVAYANYRRAIGVSCWHMNDYESAAMWSMYLKSGEGIAVQSTFSRLRDSFRGEESVMIGEVQYIDYRTQSLPDQNNMLSPFLHKRRSFEHERELRAIIHKLPIHEGQVDFRINSMDGGLGVDVDLRTLIERIYISPTAPEWFADTVSSVIRRYDFNFELVQSDLNDQPIF